MFDFVVTKLQAREHGDEQRIRAVRVALENQRDHPFDTRLLVLEGEATITCDMVQRIFRAGEVTEIERNVEHAERFGQTRVRFIVGLRHDPA